MPFEFVDQASFAECKLAASRVKIDCTALVSRVRTGIEFEDCKRYIVDLEEARQSKACRASANDCNSKIRHCLNAKCMKCDAVSL